MSISRRSDNLIRYVGPTRTSAGTVITGATVVGRLYDEDKECRTISVVTRVRSDALVSATAIEIPVFTPTLFEAGDTIIITHDNGNSIAYGVSSVSTAANFHTLNLDGGLNQAMVAGHELKLSRKGEAAQTFAIEAPNQEPEAGDVIEYETNMMDEEEIEPFVGGEPATFVSHSTATEDLEPAENQRSYFALTSTTPGATVDPNRRVRVKLGADIAMSQYGVATAGNDDWGYEGTILDTHVLFVGQTVRVEIEFNGGPNLQEVVSLVEKVVE